VDLGRRFNTVTFSLRCGSLLPYTRTHTPLRFPYTRTVYRFGYRTRFPLFTCPVGSADVTFTLVYTVYPMTAHTAFTRTFYIAPRLCRRSRFAVGHVSGYTCPFTLLHTRTCIVTFPSTYHIYRIRSRYTVYTHTRRPTPFTRLRLDGYTLPVRDGPTLPTHLQRYSTRTFPVPHSRTHLPSYSPFFPLCRLRPTRGFAPPGLRSCDSDGLGRSHYLPRIVIARPFPTQRRTRPRCTGPQPAPVYLYCPRRLRVTFCCCAFRHCPTFTRPYA